MGQTHVDPKEDVSRAEQVLSNNNVNIANFISRISKKISCIRLASLAPTVVISSTTKTRHIWLDRFDINHVRML